MNKQRDYQRENELYKSKPDQIHKRVERNKARRLAIKQGRVHVGDGRELDHIRPLSKGGSSVPSNLRVTSKSRNSSFSRNADGSVKRNKPTTSRNR